MINLRNKIIELKQQTAVKQIALVVTPTGAIVQDRIFKGEPVLKSKYEKGIITISDNQGKTVDTLDLNSKPKREDKPAVKKKSKDNTPDKQLPGTDV